MGACVPDFLDHCYSRYHIAVAPVQSRTQKEEGEGSLLRKGEVSRCLPYFLLMTAKNLKDRRLKESSMTGGIPVAQFMEEMFTTLKVKEYEIRGLRERRVE